ncbi:hypothetical protein AWB76_03253 [Caballeronia temeraria]|uniref:Uncharacterized protein n=1 Tax=Caballeronia temeraria TaxID=1777137 RepID=A0A158AWT9_9BURK|nr:hypothetical protein [Caballeronia temeraria]SAK62481.1 hypothetical protein AWB76_03253 [Caballeronia temeraria]
MHPFLQNRKDRRADERAHRKLLQRVGKSAAQAAADVSLLHSAGHALMWYACTCGHRERLWNSRDGGAPFAIPCPSCGDVTLMHATANDDIAPHHVPHEGQRVLVDMTRAQAEQIVARMFAKARVPLDHPRFDQTVADLLAHTTGEMALVAVAGDVAYYAGREVAA